MCLFTPFCCVSELFETVKSRMLCVEGAMGLEYACVTCGKILNHKHSMMTHIESHLSGFSHKCPYCKKDYKTRNSMNSHISRTHKQAKAVPELNFQQ